VTRTFTASTLDRSELSDAGAELGISSQPGRVRGSRAPSSAFDEACASAVEQLDLLLGVAADLVVGRQIATSSRTARAELVREVRRRRADERVDVVASGSR
jgi:hypothetical protein